MPFAHPFSDAFSQSKFRRELSVPELWQPFDNLKCHSDLVNTANETRSGMLTSILLINQF